MNSKKDLTEAIKSIAEMNGIPESRLILDEARFFISEHKGHGNIQLRLDYDANNYELVYIGLYCNSIDLVDREKCSHYYGSLYGGGDSVIYSKTPLEDITTQQERRK